MHNGLGARVVASLRLVAYPLSHMIRFRKMLTKMTKAYLGTLLLFSDILSDY